MKIPSEEQIASAFSEIKVHAATENEAEHKELCDFCLICDEFNHRTKIAPADKVCVLEEATFSMCSMFPGTQQLLAAPVIGEELSAALSMVARVSFLIGLKSTRAMDESEKMNEMFCNVLSIRPKT
jgi:hypothetical protein